MHRIAMLGTGLIGLFYTRALHEKRKPDRVQTVYSRTRERAESFAREWDIPKATDDLEEAITGADTDVVVIGLPNQLHEKAVRIAADAGKAVLCTKPLGRNAREAKNILEAVEKAGVFHGYLEDLVYTPKHLKAVAAVKGGSLGRILWVRSREAHPGPHSDWFWDKDMAGGGAVVDLGCHCIEIARNFIGKDDKPVEVVCWADTQVHPIDAEDSAIGLVRYASGAIGQFEVAWSFRGGMDLRDEVSGVEGTIWLDHFLRTGLEMFTAVGPKGYVAEKAEGATGWIFPVGDEISELGYADMFSDMFDALDSGGQPVETFYDGYVVNAVMDACYRSVESKRWEPVQLEIWRGAEGGGAARGTREYDESHYLIKEEKMPDGKVKLILKEKAGGRIVQRIV